MKKISIILLAAVCAASLAYGQESQQKLVGGKTNGAAYNPDSIELVYVEGVGAIQGFYIGKYEVTQAQWQSVMGYNPSTGKGATRPVEMVSWYDAQEFLENLNTMTGRNYRLPTAAEWEYAANGGKNRDTYEYAGSNSINDVAWYEQNSGCGGCLYSDNISHTHPVGQKLPNSIGIYDMSGNVWEWCQDWHNEGSTRAIRGGSWYIRARYCRVATRGASENPDARGSNGGFRIVLP
ncbi:hypothetical protein AGMMS4956_20510 [Bacteroidia bacterium]|nr:hypothetical protein AGMMS4956_20510 [Bacteroidia bacterium]